MYILKKSLLSLACLLILWGCQEKEELDNFPNGKINNITYDRLTHNKVALSAKVDANGLNVISGGFCYGTAPGVNVANGETLQVNIKSNTIEGEILGLSSSTTYYVKAYVLLYNDDPLYSSEISFTTPNSNDDGLGDYTPPAFIDNYTGFSQWGQRHRWNLANVHDPTVMKAEDGYFYMYQTDASYGNEHVGHGHFHARRSKDLVNWEYLGATMPNTPSWVKVKLNEIRAMQGLPLIESPVYGYWAPVARKVTDGKYRMYYSIIIDNYIKTGKPSVVANFDNSWTERAFIGMMETDNPGSNKWEDKGFVMMSSSDKAMNDWTRKDYNGSWGTAYFKWNAIDPTYVITNEGEHWLAYGSWHSGIAGVRLNPETGKPLVELDAPWLVPTVSPFGQLIYTRKDGDRWQGSEAPEIIYNSETGYYYLFLAYDALDVPYNTRVCRSKHIGGPYYGIDGRNVTAGGEVLPVVTHPYKFNNDPGWVGFSHCAVFDDGAGNWFYASQARLPIGVPGIHASNAVMMGHVRSIRWTSDGWPVVMPERYGAVPNVPIREEELVGNWENIDLSYKYGVQKESTLLSLGENHTVINGTWKGKEWSYDENAQILRVNGIELCLQREVDWESVPRKHTIVYSGYTETATFWGKKK